jgi:hypothetical protein
MKIELKSIQINNSINKSKINKTKVIYRKLFKRSITKAIKYNRITIIEHSNKIKINKNLINSIKILLKRKI